MKLKLSRGTTGFWNESNQWVCTGSQMGRASRIPSKLDGPLKFHLQRLEFVDGDYDKGGAYWGSPANVYIARSNDETDFGDSLQTVETFVRANSREEAKQKVLAQIPSAKFYR